MAASTLVRFKTFMDFFKFYKRRRPPPDLSKVIDMKNPDPNIVKRIKARVIQESSELGLKSTNDWKLYEFVDIPGLIFIENPFTATGQRYWIIKSLKDYTKPPNKLNLDSRNLLQDNETWWDVSFENDNARKELIPKLRWATLGYHYNWETKHYSEDWKSEMPVELKKLTKLLAQVVGFQEFNAQAAIINYYQMKSTLAGHTDNSEVNIKAPLFSVSFGQAAVFLIGGLTREDPVDALFIRSGDVIILSGDSRLRYHGIPKILPTDIKPWELDSAKHNSSYENWKKAEGYISEARINLNIRQVLRSNQTTLC